MRSTALKTPVKASLKAHRFIDLTESPHLNEAPKQQVLPRKSHALWQATEVGAPSLHGHGGWPPPVTAAGALLATRSVPRLREEPSCPSRASSCSGCGSPGAGRTGEVKARHLSLRRLARVAAVLPLPWQATPKAFSLHLLARQAAGSGRSLALPDTRGRPVSTETRPTPPAASGERHSVPHLAPLRFRGQAPSPRPDQLPLSRPAISSPQLPPETAH